MTRNRGRRMQGNTSVTRIVLLLSVLLASWSPPAAAQQLPEVVRSLRPEQVIRIRTVRHGEHVGRFTGLQGDTLHLLPERGSSRVALDAVEQLWVRGTAAKTGALIGAIGGGVLSGAFFAWFTSALCETESCETLEAGIVGGLLGAGVGALGGAVLGTFVDKWHRRWP